MNVQKPKRKVSYQEKVTDDYKYCKDWIDWCIQASRWHSLTIDTYNAETAESLLVLYDIANGKINKDWFNYITNAFNFGKDKSLPARIDDYNVIFPHLSYLEGKKLERPFNYQVEDFGSNDSTKEIEEQEQYIQAELKKIWDEDSDAAQDAVEFEKGFNKFLLTFKENLALRNQDIMTYILQDDRTKEKLMECWKHWYTAGEAYMRLDVENDRIVTTPISPLYFATGKKAFDFNNTYVEDQDWVCVRYFWSSNEILDKLGHNLTQEEVEKIDRPGLSITQRYNMLYTADVYEDKFVNLLENIECLHTQWKVFKKIGIVTYPNPLTGEEEEMEVDESFVLDNILKEQGYKVKWEWITEIWEGWKINNDIYTGIRPLPVQNGHFNYLGKRFRNLHSKNTSIIRLGLPYIKLFCVLWYKIELAVAKSQGQIALMPIEALTGGEGSEEYDYKEFLYTSQALGIGIYSMSNPALKGQSLNNFLGNVTISSANEIKMLIELAEYVKQSWMAMIGISQASLAQQSTDKGLGVTQSELYQSSVITEPIFQQFEYFEERLLQAMMDYSKYAYVKGKKAKVIRDDNSIAYLNIEDGELPNKDLGVFIVKSSEENKILEGMRSAALDLASQGKNSSEIFEIIAAKNTAKLKNVLYKLQEMEMENAKAQAENEEKLKQDTIQIQQTFEEFKHHLEMDKLVTLENLKFEHQRELELIKLESNELAFQGTTDADNNGIPDVNEAEKRSNERLKMALDTQLKTSELMLKNKEIDSKERTEKLKAKVALKNKVAGEK